MWKMITIALAAGMFLAFTPPTAAFHGAPYILNGVAEFGPTGQLWNARLEWSGAGGAGGQFRVTLSDQSTGATLLSQSVQGGEAIPVAAWVTAGVCLNGLLEVVHPYVGRDAQAAGLILNVQGVQENCLYNGSRYMHVEGTYLTVWNIDVQTGNAFGTQWE